MTDKPWKNEPDYLEGSYGDVPWFIVRTSLGHLCGYIVVPKHHPWYSVDVMLTVDIDVHGGVTWESEHFPGITGEDTLGERAREITQRFPGKFIGFDCGHYGDLIPGMLRIGHIPFADEIYRDINYVREECERLAMQAIAAIESRMLTSEE